MKISGLSCETKKIFLVFLGHPNIKEWTTTKPLQPYMKCAKLAGSYYITYYTLKNVKKVVIKEVA